MTAFLIAAKELKSLFGSILAWAILAVLQFILAYLFLAQVDSYVAMAPQINRLANPPGVTQLVVAPLFGNVAVVLLMAIPLLTMRSFAEERRYRTLPFLMSAPVSLSEIVLGKFAGLMGFLALVCLLPVAMGLSLLAGGSLDLGLIAANTIGLFLLVASLVALGVYLSSLTASPVVAAFLSLGAFLFLWILNVAAADPDSSLRFLSIFHHFENFNSGILRLGDALFFLFFAAAFLALTVRHLDSERVGG